MEYNFQILETNYSSHYDKEYTNVSLKLTVLSLIQIVFSVVSLVRVWILQKHKKGCSKGNGKKINDAYYYSQGIRLFCLLLLYRNVISYET